MPRKNGLLCEQSLEQSNAESQTQPQGSRRILHQRTSLAGTEGIHTVEQIKGNETKKNYFLTEWTYFKVCTINKSFFLNNKKPSHKSLWF